VAHYCKKIIIIELKSLPPPTVKMSPWEKETITINKTNGSNELKKDIGKREKK
jgi:hypothetical protein